jgi:hypothetical protein
MVDPTRPDLRESSRSVPSGITTRVWSPHTPPPTDAPPTDAPPPSAPDTPADGEASARQTLRYLELLRTLEAIGETLDRLNSQIRGLLTQVACQLAEDSPNRPPPS